MEKKFIPLIILLAFVLPACTKNFSSPERMTVALEECAQKTTGTEELVLCFDAIIEDSRCPINANCVWQGVGIARFTLLLNGQEHQLELATNDVRPGTRTDTTLQQYTISLHNLHPYPGEESNKKPYAEVDIKKR